MLTENFELQKAEQALLGLLLADNKLTPSVVHELKPEFFNNDVHGIIYNSILKLWDSIEAIDIYTVSWHLRKTDLLSACGGDVYLQFLLSQKGEAQHLRHYMELVNEAYIINQAKKIGLDLFKTMEQATTKPQIAITSTIKELNELCECFYQEKSKSISDLIHASVMERNKVQQFGKGINTGYAEFDKSYGGLAKGEYLIIGGRPGMGKTSFLLNLALNLSKKGTGVLYLSYESNPEYLMRKIIAMELEIPLSHLTKGDLNDQEWNAIKTRAVDIDKWPLFIKESLSHGVDDLTNQIRRIKSGKNVDVVIVDYLQMIEPLNKRVSREQAISEVSRRMKQLARELDIAIVVSSQLSRQVETRTGNKIPMLVDLRESGSIEQDADKVLFIYRPEYYRLEENEFGESSFGLAEMIIAKNRNGVTGQFNLQFIPRYGKFEERNNAGKYYENQFQKMREAEFKDDIQSPF